MSTSHESTPIRLPQDDFRRVVELTPLISIDLIARDATGRMLLGYRRNRPAQGFWFVPGGRVGKNERLSAAFRRLTGEELGADFDIAKARFLGVFEHLYDDNFAGDPAYGTHYVVLGYEFSLDTGAFALPREQHSDYRWLSDGDCLAAPDVHENTKAYARLGAIG